MFQRIFLLLLTTLVVSSARAQEPVIVATPEEVLPPPRVAASQLALQDFEQFALENNPTLVQAVAQVNISRGKAIQAGLYPNPTVGYVGDQIGANRTAGELQGGFIEQEIVRGGKLKLSRAKYQQEVLQAQAQLDAQHYRVLTSVREAFYAALATQRQVNVRRQMLKNTEDALNTTRGLVNVGQANRADLLQAQIQAQRVRVALATATRRYKGHWQELAAVVGTPDLPSAQLDGQLEINENEVLNRDDALQNLLQCSPQLRAAWAEVAKDQLGVQRERAEPIPNINIRAETGYNYETRNSVAGINVGFQLPIFDRNQGSILQAQGELARARAEVERIDLVLRRQFAETFTDYENAQATAKSFNDEVLPKAKEAYEFYQDAYQNRRAAWPQVLVAQREYFQLTDEYLETLMELRRAEAEIKGMFLGSGLEQPMEPTPQGHREATPRPR